MAKQVDVKLGDYEKTGVLAPNSWSDKAVSIAARMYFAPNENSIYEMVRRVVDVIQGDEDDPSGRNTTFGQDLEDILLAQKAAFNTPVWMNIGVKDRTPQAWACLILGVEDSMKSIQEGWIVEAETFRGGSGSGVNVSRIRADGEPLIGGGVGSGPISLWMRPTNEIANVVKSGGRTRRAAKMVVMDVDHPQIMEFIRTKADAENMARDLLKLGYDIHMTGKDSGNIPFQQANNSVRVRDDFMVSVDMQEPYLLEGRTTSDFNRLVPANDIWDAIAQAAWECGDPGIQFHDTTNAANTCLQDGEITASNPCSEYLWLDNTVCNLASINLMKYYDVDEGFDFDSLQYDVGVMIEAMDRLVDISSYPTELIDKTSKQYRTLGLGFTNLGALLMSKGLAYDSDAGRAWAAAIMAVIQGAATEKSQQLAVDLGAYPAWNRNRKPQARVIANQRSMAKELAETLFVYGLDRVIKLAWQNVDPEAMIRNAQLTVIAPTGTISLMMDCETTGIEPVLAINAEKTLSGGGHLNVGVADCVLAGMKALKLDPSVPLNAYELTDKEKKVFETALGNNVVAPEGHVRMMAAVQPFVSGGISKTVNLPNSATVEDVKNIYKLAWETECKAIAIFRDGCKAYQPVNIVREEVTITPVQGVTAVAAIPVSEVLGRKKPPATRPAVTNEFDIAGERYYVTVSYYPDTGKPCEIFIHGRKHGSAIAGWIDTASILFSKLLQRGVPIEELVRDFQRTNFAPQGMVISDSSIKSADSPLDYIVRWIPQTYPGGVSYVEPPAATTQQFEATATYTIESLSGEECFDCGSSNTRWAGTCRVCSDCGSTSGCS